MIRRTILTSFSALLLSLSGFAQTSEVNDVHRIATAVDHHYDGLKTLQTNFTEEYHGPGISRRESGELWLKKPGKMHWDYTQPRPKLFISDGKTAWFYVPGEQQARRAAVNNLDDLHSPLRYLLGKTKLEREFRALTVDLNAKPSAAGDILLRGVPKGMEDRVNSVLLEISPGNQIVRIQIEQSDGSTMTFNFNDQKENVAVPEDRFHFSPPPGVEVMEAKELGQ